MDKLKLKWKVFSVFISFGLILLSILWIFQTVLLTDMYKFIRRYEINNAIINVSQNINNPNLETILYNLEREKDIIVKATNDFIKPKEENLYKDEKDDEVKFKKRPFPESITNTQEFKLQNGEDISLTFYAVITPVDATVSTLKTQLYIITLIMFILSIIIAIIISKKISKPIEDINESAKILAKGDYEINFNGTGFLEINELSNTLNITARQLSKTEELRRELIANISHDLRTPLTLIYSYAEMMNDFPNEITQLQTQMIMDETMRLTSLVNDVFDISKFENGNVMLNKIKFNLTKSVKVVVERMYQLVKKNGYIISFQADDDIYINADEVKIMQAFYNLLINAINYSLNNKNIIIRIINLENFARIEVVDNGAGINQEQIPYIWDRYYKGGTNHKRALTGTGLGLSIVKKIVNLHSGNYGVESQVNNGSTFWFEIPYSI